MEAFVEPLELSNLFNAGIQIPKIDKNVTIFMLCHDSPIGITRLALDTSTSVYYFNTNGYNNTRYVDDDELSEKCDIDITYQFCGNKYLSAEDLKKGHDVDYLLNNIGDKIPNWFMKIKNPEFNKNIILPNGQNVVFSKQEESLTVYFHNVYLDPENNNEIITLYIDSNDKLTTCYTGYEPVMHCADEFWIAFFKPIVSKNARNI